MDIMTDTVVSALSHRNSAGHSPQTVAVDIDGVMADFNAAMKPHSLVHNTMEVAPYDYNMVRSGWFHNWDDFDHAHHTVMDKAGSMPLNDTTVAQGIQTLSDSGFRVIAVTARKEAWRAETLKFFAQHGINITSERLIMTDETTKTAHHFDYLIDDAPHNIEDVVSNSAATPIIYHQRYNRHIRGLRAHRFDEAVRIILNMAAGKHRTPATVAV